jgi:hypothetical protein
MFSYSACWSEREDHFFLQGHTLIVLFTIWQHLKWLLTSSALVSLFQEELPSVSSWGSGMGLQLTQKPSHILLPLYLEVGRFLASSLFTTMILLFYLWPMEMVCLVWVFHITLHNNYPSLLFIWNRVYTIAWIHCALLTPCPFYFTLPASSQAHW